MANRKGVFIGAYVPNQLKEALQQRARAEHRTLSQEITRILEEAIKGKRLPPGMIDRRAEGSGPRRLLQFDLLHSTPTRRFRECV